MHPDARKYTELQKYRFLNVLKQELEDFLNDFCHQMLMKEVQ